MLRVRIGTRTRTIVFSGAGIAALLALAVATAAFDLPDQIAEQHRAFERGNTPPGTSDLRTRLTEVGNNGRLAIWHVALEEAKQNRAARRRGRHVPARVGARPAGAAGARGRRPLALLRGAGRARLGRHRRCC